MRSIKLTYVGFRAHVKIASRIVLYRIVSVADPGGVQGVQGGNVTSAGWQVTLCDPIWHVSSRSGVATLRTALCPSVRPIAQGL